jgi:hypothetical protein
MSQLLEHFTQLRASWGRGFRVAAGPRRRSRVLIQPLASGLGSTVTWQVKTRIRWARDSECSTCSCRPGRPRQPGPGTRQGKSESAMMSGAAAALQPGSLTRKLIELDSVLEGSACALALTRARRQLGLGFPSSEAAIMMMTEQQAASGHQSGSAAPAMSRACWPGH